MKISSLFISLLISATCTSQKNDYIVKINGDTIWSSVLVKKNKIFQVTGDNIREISAAEIKQIACKKYKGNIVVPCTLQLYTDNIHNLEMGYDKQNHVDTVMILEEILNTPKMNLYFGKDNQKSDYYFYKTPADSVPLQLVVRYHLDGGFDNYEKDPVRYGGNNAAIYITEDKGYINQLHFIMGDCEKIPDTMWELLTYRSYSLIQLVKKYNKCK